MEIFSFVEAQGPDYFGYITDAGRVLTWVPSTDRKWLVHIHGEPWLDDTYAKDLEEALNMIAVPHDNCMDIVAALQEIHGCDPFEDVEDIDEQEVRSE